MRRSKGTAAGLLAVMMTVLVTTGFGAAPHGKEVIKIVSKVPGPYHAKVIASGAFSAKGYFLHRRASLVFPHGRLAVRRHVTSTSNRPPNLATCWFKARQTGTFRVFYATGKYHGLRYGGTFTTAIAGRLNKTGPNQCGTKIVIYHAVSYETGIIP